MAYMYNSEHHQNKMISPRISFSNDFVMDSSAPSIKHETPVYRPEAPVDPSAPEFEFSAAGNHSMISSDEVFFNGRMMPMKESWARVEKMTLRDELRNDEEGGRGGYVAQSSRHSKVPIRWKELLGLRKAPPAVPKKQR